MDSGEALLYTNHQGQRRNFAYCPKENGHWILSTRNPMQPSIFSHSTTNEEITQPSRSIHEAMGHLGHKALSLLHTATTASHFKGRGSTTIECEACALAKAKQLIIRTSEKTYPVEAPFQQVNIDLFSFLPDKSRYKYVLILAGSWTGFTMAYSLKSKDASSDAILEAFAMIATQFDRKVKSIRLDNETALKTDKFLSKTNKMEIILLSSAPYTLPQNGRAERAGGEVNRRVRAICIQSKFSSLLWGELVKTACFLLNRTPQYHLGNKTPFEVVFRKQPDITHIRPIGSKAYVSNLIPKVTCTLQHLTAYYLLNGPNVPPKLQKLSAEADVGYLIEYDGANKFRIWNPAKDVIIVTRDVTFNENSRYQPIESKQDPLLIRDESILESIDHGSIQESASTRYPHQLADSDEDTLTWDNIYQESFGNDADATHNQNENAELESNHDRPLDDQDTSDSYAYDQAYLTPNSLDNLSRCSEQHSIIHNEIDQNILDDDNSQLCPSPLVLDAQV
ncbi:hypothetical protein K3495_g7344 [Podosphaera aphanis]|nr:hypothetical protein K3495_g7344 [Podosphaera aphanis]